MKHLKKHWSTRPLSFLLSALMALPILSLLLIRISAVQAQGLAPRQPVWAVLDFANPSGYGSGDVGRLASDSFVVQLAKLNRYTVLPREQIETGIQNENLTPPLNLTSIERLGASLGVDAIVAGEISSISFSRDRRQARVAVAVRVIDPKSGYLLNGALAEGLSNPRPIPVDDEEQLVNEAFGNAAFNAVKQLSKFDLPVATVLISGNNTLNGKNVTVTINKGSRDGIRPGLDMLVSRRGQYVGTIRVGEPTDNDANCEITDIGLGIEPGDRATAIYHMPDYSVNKTTGSYQTASAADLSADAPSTPGHSSPFKGVGGILLAVLAGALLFRAIQVGHQGTDTSLGGANVSNVAAVEGRVDAIGGGATNIPTGYPVAADFIPVAVRITAGIGAIDASNFFEFHVYRSDAPTDLSNAQYLLSSGVAGFTESTVYQLGNNTGTTTGTATTGTTGTTVGIGVLGINGFGQVPLLAQVSKNLNVFDDFNLKQSVVASKPDPSDSSTLITLTASTFGIVTTTTTTGTATGTTGTTTVNPTFAGGIPGTGLGFGQRVSYAIEGLYLQPATLNTGSTTGTGINPGTGNTGTATGTTTSTNNGGNTNGTTNGATTGTTNSNGGTSTSTSTSTNTSGNPIAGNYPTFQLTSLRNTNTITYIVPVYVSGTAVTSTGSSNVNITVPATAGANDYILQISPDVMFGSGTKTFAAAAGAYNVTNPQTNPNQVGQPISVAAGTAVVFNNINLNTDFPGSTTLFYRIGARNSADNGQANYGNSYVFNDPLQLGLTASTLKSSIDSLRTIPHRGRF